MTDRFSIELPQFLDNLIKEAIYGFEDISRIEFSPSMCVITKGLMKIGPRQVSGEIALVDIACLNLNGSDLESPASQ